MYKDKITSAISQFLDAHDSCDSSSKKHSKSLTGVKCFQGMAALASMPSGPGIGPMFSKISGSQQQAAYTDQATATSQQATFAYQQGMLQAAQNDYAVTKAKSTQDAQFNSSGVTLSGSPLAILTETQGLGNQVSTAYRLQGTLQSQLLGEQGLQYLRSGSAAAFSGQADADNMNYQFELQKAQTVDSAIAGIGGGILNGAMSIASMGTSSIGGAALSGLGNAIGGMFNSGGCGGFPTYGGLNVPGPMGTINSINGQIG